MCPMLQMFELRNFAFIGIMKHEHEIHNVDRKFDLIEIWDKCETF